MADKGYKAFRPGFYCEHDGNRKQYYENSIAEDTGANGCCNQGVMHYCEAPLDTLDYYPLFDDEGRMLSGGESQKVAIARAFYKNCPYIILDEPSANLDPIA